MVELVRVRAYHPANPAASDLLSPVYDTLSDEDYRRFSRIPHNAATFVARPSSMDLEAFLRQAPAHLRDALAAGAYVRDTVASLYVYGIRYTPPSDIQEALPAESRRAEYLLLGLVGALDLAHTPESSIARHENAFTERIDERVRLTQATGVSFAPIMAGYTLPSHAINDLLEQTLGLHRRSMSLEGTATPLVRATLDGTEHRLWKLDDELVQAKVTRLLEPLRILVLDGHHRYGAARELLRRGEPGSSPLVMLVESRDRALQLLPWHRALATGPTTPELLTTRTGPRFVSVEPLTGDTSVEALVAELGRISRHHARGFLAIEGARAWRFVGPDSTDGGSDFDLLHGYLGEEFHRDPHDFGVFRSPRQAVEAVRSRASPWSGGIAFLMPRLRQEAIEERAFTTGRVMAHKSTMFLPKVAEGVVFAPVGASRAE
ncbi:MAG: DUF1015 family protein [Thermoplasmata archaeon]